MKRQTLEDLKNVMRTLRGPNGCPWDKEQTPESLTAFAVEEALELEDAILHKGKNEVMEEMGDLLFQVVFQSQMAEERGDFNLDDVIHHLSAKMIERHPHVFTAEGDHLSHRQDGSLDSSGVLQNWEQGKNKKLTPQEIFNIPGNFPSLLKSVKIGKKTRAIDFDWKKTADVWKHFLSEVKELQATLKSKSKKRQEEELGDALFTLAQVARHLQIDPEKALRQANRKIVDRIFKIHKMSELSWADFAKLPAKKKDVLWNELKRAKKMATKKTSSRASRT